MSKGSALVAVLLGLAVLIMAGCGGGVSASKVESGLARLSDNVGSCLTAWGGCGRPFLS